MHTTTTSATKNPETLISIITPVYNASQLVIPTILSIKEQSQSNLVEHVIVDGASTDDTLAIVEKHQWHNMKILSEPDMGIYHAMNKGIRLATAPYIMFLNAGDILYSPNTIELVIEQIKKGIQFIYGNFLIYKRDGSLWEWHKKPPPPSLLSWKSFLKGMVINHQSMIVSKDIAPEFNLKYKYVADIDWCIRLMKKNPTVAFLNTTITLYLYGGFSHRKRLQSLIERAIIMVKHSSFLHALKIHLEILMEYKRMRYAGTLTPWHTRIIEPSLQ